VLEALLLCQTGVSALAVASPASEEAVASFRTIQASEVHEGLRMPKNKSLLQERGESMPSRQHFAQSRRTRLQENKKFAIKWQIFQMKTSFHAHPVCCSTRW
jgi:hypothetical protein